MQNDTSVLTLRKHAIEMFSEGVNAADPKAAVIRSLMSKTKYTLNESVHHALNISKCPIQIISFGKAAIPMIEGAIECIDNTRLKTMPIAVTNYQNVVDHPKIEVLGAGHPIPNEDGLIAAEKIKKTAQNAGTDDLILALISGGASALLPMPAASISLRDKQELTQLLLFSGANIYETNTVRKHISNIKGGGLVRFTSPSTLQTLIISDVIDNDISTIASGLATGDPTTFNEAVSILQSLNIWEKTPTSIQDHLSNGCYGLTPETLFPDDPMLKNTFNSIIASNLTSLNAVSKCSKAKGYKTIIVNKMLVGESRNAATEFISKIAKRVEKPTAYISGGETTVTVRGSGSGGRNQEMALALAIEANSKVNPNHWVFLSGSTDGIDGPTNAAGGLVDSKTSDRIKMSGHDAARFLEDNNSYQALSESGDLIITGSSGTNVADIQILLMHPG
ncbi:MAG: glycerate kinase [Acidiferrobacteraceae bacterium]|nr:glycerate kinase [Acidiferrobacteraceae bacterium]|tara:strand:- start:13361 stop:14707 length:1347 start_codon:yes stop_codon:yes gene_type:complete